MVMEFILNLAASYPRVSVVVIGGLITLVSTLLMMKFTDQEHIKSLKKRQKELQKEIKACKQKNDSCGMEKLNKEAMEIAMKLMKSSFSLKQLLVTAIPFILVIQWMRDFYGGESGVLSSWFWWYLGSALVLGNVYRKLFKMA